MPDGNGGKGVVEQDFSWLRSKREKERETRILQSPSRENPMT
jgi:hypothetical protein